MCINHAFYVFFPHYTIAIENKISFSLLFLCHSSPPLGQGLTPFFVLFFFLALLNKSLIYPVDNNSSLSSVSVCVQTHTLEVE